MFRKVWEYLEVRSGINREVDLNAFGLDGWELVAARQHPSRGDWCTYIFKRER